MDYAAFPPFESGASGRFCAIVPPRTASLTAVCP